MKQIRETDKLLLFEEKQATQKKYYRQHKEKETEPVLIYIKKTNRFIFEFDGVSIKKVTIEGHSSIPSYMNSYGYGFDNKSLNGIIKQLDDSRINNVLISKSKKSKKQGTTLIISEEDLQKLLTNIGQEQYACNATKKILVTNLLVEIYPSFSFDFKGINSNKNVVIRNLNEKLIDKLTADDVDAIGDFYIKAAQKFKRPDVVKKMNIKLSKASQLLTLTEIIDKIEKLLAANPAEKKWQELFDEYITFFDSRYAHKLNYKNIATGLTKYPDLVLVDIYGYIDFYELKKSGEPLIEYDSSHKTWYWTKEVSKVIAQTSDYLQKARDNAKSYSSQIKIETETEDSDGIEVDIVNPKGIIVIGTSAQLNSAKKRNNFKALRESLKDIEFLLYDELLERLKNLKNSLTV